jgi:ribose transport system substrate-binding protein
MRLRRTVPVTIAFATALALGLSSCSSSGGTTDNSTSGTSDTGVSTPAGTTTGGAAPSSGGAASGFAEAKSLTATYQQEPTSIGITQPVGKPIPTGKTVVLVGAGPSGSGTIVTYNGFKAAAKILGWNVKMIQPAAPTPQDFQQALQQAIQLKPDAVVTATLNPGEVTAQLKQLQSMHIPVIDNTGTMTSSDPVTLELMGVAGLSKHAAAIADKVLADMGGPGTIGMVGITAYAIINDYSKGFSNEIKRLCPTCTIKTTMVPVSSLGTSAGTDIVNFVRANSGMKALFVGWDGMDANLFSAEKSAGVTLPKTYSVALVPENLANLSSGSLTASSGFDTTELGWRVADALARIFTGQTASALQQDVQYERPVIWSKDYNNVPTAPSDGSYPPVVSDYQAQYKKLWGK